MSFSARAVAFAKLWLLSFVVSIGLLAPGLVRADGLPFDRIVVFGDSLSDSGNLFALTGNPGGPHNNWGMDTPDELISLIPGQAYTSRRLSNGLTWVELLGTALGLGANVRPVFADPLDPRRFNFAVAGATAANPEGLPDAHPLHLSGQVAVFLARAASIGTTSDTLYVVAIGGNDLRATVQLGRDVLTEALGSIDRNIRALYAVGGRKFLIWNIPDVGATPAFQRLQNGVPELGFGGFPGIAELATALIAGPAPDRDGGYNAALKAHLHFLSTAPETLGGLPGVEFIYFDAFDKLTEVRAHPRRYGLTNVDDPCIQVVPFFTVPGTCRHPDRHLFWDGIHPTRAGHAIIAFLVGKTLVEALQEH